MLASEVFADYGIDISWESGSTGSSLNRDHLLRVWAELDGTRRKTPATLLTSQSIIQLFTACKRLIEHIPISYRSTDQNNKIRLDVLNVIRWMLDSTIARNGTLVVEILEVLVALIVCDNEANSIHAIRIVNEMVKIYRNILLRRSATEPPLGLRFVANTVAVVEQMLRKCVANTLQRTGLLYTASILKTFIFERMVEHCFYSFEFVDENGDKCTFLPKSFRSLKVFEELFILLHSLAELCLEAFKTVELLPVLKDIIRLKTINITTVDQCPLIHVGKKSRLLAYEPSVYTDLDFLVDIMQLKLRCIMFVSLIVKSMNVSDEQQQQTFQLLTSESFRMLDCCPRVRMGPLLHSQIARILRRVMVLHGQSSMFELLFSQVIIDNDEGIMKIGRGYFALTTTRTTSCTILAEMIRNARQFFSRKELFQFMRVISLFILDWTLTWRARFSFLNLLLGLSDQFKVLISSASAVPIDEEERGAGLELARQRLMFGRLLEILYFRLDNLCGSAELRPPSPPNTSNHDNQSILRTLTTSDRRRTNHHEYMNIDFKIDLNECRSIVEIIFQLISTISESLLHSTFLVNNDFNHHKKLNDLNAYELHLYTRLINTMMTALDCFARTDPYAQIQISAEFDELKCEINAEQPFQLRSPRDSPKQAPVKLGRPPLESTSSTSNTRPEQQQQQTYKQPQLSNANQCLLHAFRDTFLSINDPYLRILSSHLIGLVIDRRGNTTTYLQPNHHLILHLVQTLIECRRLVNIVSYQIVKQLCAITQWTLWEIALIFQVLRSLNRLPELDRKVYQLVFEHYMDDIVQLLMYAQLKSSINTDLALVWLEVFRAAICSTKYDWMNEAVVKRIPKIIEFLNLSAAGKQRAQHKAIMYHICLLATACCPTQVGEVVHQLAMPIAYGLVSRKHNPTALHTNAFCLGA